MKGIIGQLAIIITIGLISLTSGSAQNNTTLSEERTSILTYPFSDPNPVPIITTNDRIYPYFRYEGYSHEGSQSNWNVINLENEFIKVQVLPEVGGKVWGAIDKKTGEEFIYRNEVLKFRNISMRGPWTSGGIEFNFGIIGHHPSTATPVDYHIETHDDGSATCTVGNIDLPSRTQWRVKIHLPKDKAAFETEAVWYNPTPLQQSYYNWMTAAAPARNDLELFTPGDGYLTHAGDHKPWPTDLTGRSLNLYKENNFGPSKSYHVVGEYNDYFGGYYHDADYGWGHWSTYDDIPGQKMWIWALSRAGGIWEDLLTDTDGQYVEFQAGRQMVQNFAGDQGNPVTDVPFEPYSVDTWKEVWFPINDLGGLSEASPKGAMAVTKEGKQIQLRLHSFINTSTKIHIRQGGKLVKSLETDLVPMEPKTFTATIDNNQEIEIIIPQLQLEYKESPIKLKRPFISKSGEEASTSLSRKYANARQAYLYRDYAKAKKELLRVLERDPYHIDASVLLAELYYRSGEYNDALQHLYKAMSLDTYHAGANYTAGIVYRAQGDLINALESFSWATRSSSYRTNAYTQIAEIKLHQGKYEEAIDYSEKALRFDSHNIPALQVIAIALRKKGHKLESELFRKKIQAIDPLHHLSGYEKYALSNSETDQKQFISSHRSELAYQTFLETALTYQSLGLTDEAIDILSMAPDHLIIKIWRDYLTGDITAINKALDESDLSFVFPYRRETIGMLTYLTKRIDNWKLTYLRALALIGKSRNDEGLHLLNHLDNNPTISSFYMTRAALSRDDMSKVEADFLRAHELSPSWRTSHALFDHYYDIHDHARAKQIAEDAYQKYPDNYSVGLDYVKALNANYQFEKSLEILPRINVLPFEGASAGRVMYENAHIGMALELINDNNYKKALSTLENAKKWPENLGVGKPYNPEQRVINYLIAYCNYKMGSTDYAIELLEQVGQESWRKVTKSHKSHLVGAMALGVKKNNNVDFVQALLDTHGNDANVNWITQALQESLKEPENSLSEWLLYRVSQLRL